METRTISFQHEVILTDEDIEALKRISKIDMCYLHGNEKFLISLSSQQLIHIDENMGNYWITELGEKVLKHV